MLGTECLPTPTGTHILSKGSWSKDIYLSTPKKKFWVLSNQAFSSGHAQWHVWGMLHCFCKITLNICTNPMLCKTHVGHNGKQPNYKPINRATFASVEFMPLSVFCALWKPSLGWGFSNWKACHLIWPTRASIWQPREQMQRVTSVYTSTSKLENPAFSPRQSQVHVRSQPCWLQPACPPSVRGVF